MKPSIPDVIPTSWKVGAALALAGAILGAAALYREHVYNLGHAAAVSERAALDLRGVVSRVTENEALGFKQRTINEILTKAKSEEIAPVVARIAADRVRVGAAICNGPASPAGSPGAAGGDSADPPARLVRDDIERDLKALMVAVEQDLATGRACQAFVRENGLVP